MKLFLVIILVFAMAEAKKFTQEMSMACVAGTLMETKLTNAAEQCFGETNQIGRASAEERQRHFLGRSSAEERQRHFLGRDFAKGSQRHFLGRDFAEGRASAEERQRHFLGRVSAEGRQRHFLGRALAEGRKGKGRKKCKKVNAIVAKYTSIAKGGWTKGKDINCWSGCGNKGGKCTSQCGPNGFCCRKDWGDCPKEAELISTSYHSCVIGSGRVCMETNMGWIDNDGQPIMDVIIEDISSLDQTVTNVYNYDSLIKCMKNSLKKAAECGHDSKDFQVQDFAYYFCTDLLFAKGCSKFLSSTQAGK